MISGIYIYKISNILHEQAEFDGNSNCRLDYVGKLSRWFGKLKSLYMPVNLRNCARFFDLATKRFVRLKEIGSSSKL